eukprot:403369376
MPEIVIRDRTNLDDYLYEPNSIYSNKESEKLFDYIDIVFIDGDGGLLPWQKKCQKLARLYKMCKITNKCMFSAGFGLQMLVYFCATNFANLQVINNNEKGGSLQEINDVNAKLLPTLTNNQIFLDNLTGDYYIYDQQKNIWNPKGNVGLHYSRAMASLGGIAGGDLIKKVSTYSEKDNFHKPILFFSKLTDVKCMIKKQYISNPLLTGLPAEFVVDNHNSWDPHPINITNIQLVQTNYDTFAESERGPQIIQHLNTVAVQFHIDKKYKESVLVLANYVAIKLGQFQSSGKIDLTLDQAYLRQRQIIFNHIQPNLPPKKQEQLSHSKIINDIANDDTIEDFLNGSGSMKTSVKSIRKATRPMTAAIKQFTKEFQHSGLGYSKRRGAVIVDNNAVSQVSISAATLQQQTRKELNRSSSSRFVLQKSQITELSNQHLSQHSLQPAASVKDLKSSNSQLFMKQTNLNNHVPLINSQINFRPISAIPHIGGGLTRVGSAKSNLRVTFSDPQIQSSAMTSSQNHILPQTSQNSFNKQQNMTRYNSSFNLSKNIDLSHSQAQQSSMNDQKSLQTNKSSCTLRHLKNYQIEKDFKQQLKSDAENYLWKNQKEIRQMLHPTLCEEFLPEERDMNTKQGLLSSSKSQNSLLSKNVLNQTPSRQIFSRFKEFQKMPVHDMDKPVIRISSPYQGCEEDQLRKRDRQNSAKRIASNDFKTSFGKASTNVNQNFIPNYVTMDPSNPPMLHNFREENKNMWVKGPFKF